MIWICPAVEAVYAKMVAFGLHEDYIRSAMGAQLWMSEADFDDWKDKRSWCEVEGCVSNASFNYPGGEGLQIEIPIKSG